MTHTQAFAEPSDLEFLPNVCSGCAIRNSSLCGALTAEELHGLNRISLRRKLERGQHYAIEGDASRQFANVVSGVAKLVRTARDGRTQIVGLLFPSDFLGFNSKVHGDDTELYSIEAATDLQLCTFPREKFVGLLSKHPELEHRMLQRTFDELQVAREWMVLLGRKTAKERVATFLLHVAKRMKNQSCTAQDGFNLPLNRSEIADHIGLTVETVSRQFSQMRKKGILEMKGVRHVSRIDIDGLTELAGF
ncbi:MAG: Crp/Fnr family transcriptional regulator [Pseudomonadota bacterium]